MKLVFVASNIINKDYIINHISVHTIYRDGSRIFKWGHNDSRRLELSRQMLPQKILKYRVSKMAIVNILKLLSCSFK